MIESRGGGEIRDPVRRRQAHAETHSDDPHVCNSRGLSLADPITGQQHWQFTLTESSRWGPTIFGYLPDPGRLVEEVATRTDTYDNAGIFPWIITFATPEYAGGSAPFYDVFLSVNVSNVDHPYGSALLEIAYWGDDRIFVDGLDATNVVLEVETVAVRTVDPLADIEGSSDPSGTPEMQSNPNPFRFSTRLEYEIDEISAN